MDRVSYRVAQEVRSTHSQDGAIVLDIRQGQMFNLNQIGSRILELVIAGMDDQVMADTISQEFGVRRELAVSDVQEFLRALEAHQLLEKQNSAATT